MKILLLGYGKEGQAAKKYFKDQAEIDILENFTFDEIKQRDYSSYDIIFRSPSVPPLGLENESSVTKYFFEHCPCKIIGVTGTKGKGTTCSLIKSLLDAEGADAYLVGNIGLPAIEVLDDLTENSVVVYELSSFQLWDIKKSPAISVITTIEPDHLNIHNGFDDYLNAKMNIARFQNLDDYMIYFAENPDSVKIAEASPARHKIAYPFPVPDAVRGSLKLPGAHNLNNAMAAIAAVASLKNISPDEYLSKSASVIRQGLESCKGLPHRLEFLRELNGVAYYDDNFSTNPSSTRVAVQAFDDKKLVVIIGGRDKTDFRDVPEIYEILGQENIEKIVLIGELGRELQNRYTDARFIYADSLSEAVKNAKNEAEKIAPAVVLMSPAAASFDMFKNVYDRGDRFKNSILSLN